MRDINDPTSSSAELRRQSLRRRIYYKIIFVLLIVTVIAAFIPVGGKTMNVQKSSRDRPGETIDLSAFSSDPPGKKLNLLFIHHSVGGQLLADVGEGKGECCNYKLHPNGGGLRSLLEKAGYSAHQASYGSEVGDKTDTFDWPLKFKNDVGKILRVDQQSTYYDDGETNQVIVFKSCYPNSNFEGLGREPGHPYGPNLTLANAKAAYTAILPELMKHKEVLFVAMTAPPMIGEVSPEPVWKVLARKVLRRPVWTSSTGHLAREFNNWLKARNGWLASYDHKNVVVFDYYDVLTDYGASDYAEFPSGGGNDSHPNSAGNTRAARALVPFLNQAVRRSGLIP